MALPAPPPKPAGRRGQPPGDHRTEGELGVAQLTAQPFGDGKLLPSEARPRRQRGSHIVAKVHANGFTQKDDRLVRGEAEVLGAQLRQVASRREPRERQRGDGTAGSTTCRWGCA